MSSNNTGKTIANAFKVLSETCENVDKLIQFLNAQAEEQGEYVPLTSKPLLRLRNSIFNDDYILVFQKKKDKNSLYVADISLWDNTVKDDEADEARIYISKYMYATALNLNNEPISKGDFWQFADPIWITEGITELEFNAEHYNGSVKDKTQAKTDYRSLQHVVGFSVPLTDITSANAYDKIFGGFDTLAEK